MASIENSQRSRLMPINHTYPLQAVMAELDKHIQQTRRKVYIAYVLLRGVNHTPDHANALISLLKGRGSWDYLYHVNLIRYNPAKGTPKTYGGPEQREVDAYYQTLKEADFIRNGENILWRGD